MKTNEPVSPVTHNPAEDSFYERVERLTTQTPEAIQCAKVLIVRLTGVAINYVNPILVAECAETINQHYAAKDAELEASKSDAKLHSELRFKESKEYDRLKDELLLMTAGRQQDRYERDEERDQLKARVAELEGRIANALL